MGKFQKVYIPDSLLGKPMTKKHNPRVWKNVYFFKKRSDGEFKVPIVENWTVESIKTYNYETLYKVQILSDHDDIWDYYKILKTGLPKNIAQVKETVFKKKKRLDEKLEIQHFSKDKPYILNF